MLVRIAAIDGLSLQAREHVFLASEPDLCLDWRGPRRNAVCDCSALFAALPHEPSAAARDLIDLATAVYLSDIAVPRGLREDWVRELDIALPVRETEFWQESEPMLGRLTYRLTRDRMRLNFVEREEPSDDPPVAVEPFQADCVALLSGGLDSLAAAVMLLSAGRQPHFIIHDSGNATVRQSQRHVISVLEKHWPGQGRYSMVHVAPDSRRRESLSYPPPQLREPSRRARSFLFISLGIAAASAHGVQELYIGENGILTAAIPLTDARIGSLSTASTHPQVLSLFSTICGRGGMKVRPLNPFIYQTKAQLTGDILRRSLSAAEIRGTSSCWATGRSHRQCGGCVPCLIRRVAMLHSGLPDEAYEMDLLGKPLEYAGTDAYANLIDILSQVAAIEGLSDVELILEYPAILDLQAWGVSAPDLVATLRRHAEEFSSVLREHFPAAARLLG